MVLRLKKYAMWDFCFFVVYRVWTFHFYQIWNNFTFRFPVTSRNHVTRRYCGWIFFLQIWSCYIPLESCCYADSESYKNLGLKIKCSRDISNLNISWGLYFQTLFLMWLWISLTRAFQRSIIWPPLVRIVFSPYKTSSSRDPYGFFFLCQSRSYYIPLESCC